MKIVSWNCHYGLDERKAKVLWDTYPDAEIFIIQECRRTEIDSFDFDWKFKNWYGDDQEYSDLGIAVYSKSHVLNFTKEFDRSFRYVVPYHFETPIIKLILFAVWTKPIHFHYDENVIKAVNSPLYKELFNNNVIIIGDFNTGYSKNPEHSERYTKLNIGLEEKGLKNCAPPDKVSETTFFYDRNTQEYISDFCFASSALIKLGINYEPHTEGWQNLNTIKRWKGLSDHCPIMVEIKI